MAERTTGVWSVLSRPLVYEAVQYAVGAKRFLRLFLRDFVRPVAGERMLDVGCGPGEILRFLPALDYVGFDQSPAYVARARASFGDRARFVQDDVCNLPAHDLSPFDVATAIGILHHLDDGQAQRLLVAIRAGLRPGGRLLTADPCWYDGQSPLKRFVIGLDRGHNVRRLEAYHELARRVFPDARCELVTGHLPFPHAVAILACRRPEQEAAPAGAPAAPDPA